MACLNTLKLEIKTLEQIFTKNHERFRILNASVDELSCRFIGRNGKQYDIHANITETYPATPPVWFAESEETSITNAVQILTNTSGHDNHVINQTLVVARCGQFQSNLVPWSSGSSPDRMLWCELRQFSVIRCGDTNRSQDAAFSFVD
ncbi:hypothetical protein RP20_CCG027269 [Aedes albopictus]|nr:hypothetical protein RP20_CCG027269 [Aedes albopictus]